MSVILLVGQDLKTEVSDMGERGLVAKDPASPYIGGRTLQWFKVKQAHYGEGERGWEPKAKS
jgi:ATP-dependent DNA ligase